MSFFSRKNKKNKSKKDKKITKDFIQDDTLLQDMSLDIEDDFGVFSDFSTEEKKVTERTLEMPKVIEEQLTPTDSLIEDEEEKIPLELLFAKKDLETLKEDEDIKIIMKPETKKTEQKSVKAVKEHYFQTHVKQSIKITHVGDKSWREKIMFCSVAGEEMFYVLISFDSQYKVTTLHSFEFVDKKPMMKNKATSKTLNLRITFDLSKASPVMCINTTHPVDLKIKNKNAKKFTWTLDSLTVV